MAGNHEVLSRKYRPQRFQDVIHQNLAIGALQNAVKSGKIGHAYIFFGPRGVGKTTIARIFAKRLNCKNPVDNEPCNECSSCIEITKGISGDVLEIDAASNRGIENIRELRDNVKFTPMGGKYKVYIIDEVHMLTDQSFNALLKTLEEPPSHVVFVLATTEYQKIPETILSRCQDFVFKKVPLSILQDYAENLCREEKTQYDTEGLFWVAKKGDGSVRDMLSFMEQALVFTNNKVIGTEIRRMIGYHGIDFLSNFVKSLVAPESHSKALEIIETLYQEGQDIYKFLWDTIEFSHTLCLLKESVADSESVNYPREDLLRMRKEFETTDPILLNHLSFRLFDLFERIKTIKLRNSFEIKIFTEIQIKKLVEDLNKPSLSGLVDRINHLILMIQEQDEAKSSFSGFSKTNPKEDLPRDSQSVISKSTEKTAESIQSKKKEDTLPAKSGAANSALSSLEEMAKDVVSEDAEWETSFKNEFLGTDVDPAKVPKLDG
ncbi:DNA polymerase III, subunit gamma and tau [Leptospira inadai serovar Lyme str. 10]|uniref:DNA polymerase III subunit gamma/tau n=2 Tax=Leptospira inadai serovar Lyme TaxID=293084 RepID=V6H7L4_9LEPT|nr:DNA polymerase III subunit gamma/tau [Leptospira inadai]EQA34696.1 DNA polymerase III, subunit gamma and tau [Leptospira inadai serovar Lyme str. 10]PNV75284.1 DNA polymerase III subunit gamma/tau [Leptospira inadai serovar Lyme]